MQALERIAVQHEVHPAEGNFSSGCDVPAAQDKKILKPALLN
jgi:hypothetical protein